MKIFLALETILNVFFFLGFLLVFSRALSLKARNSTDAFYLKANEEVKRAKKRLRAVRNLDKAKKLEGRAEEILFKE